MRMTKTVGALVSFSTLAVGGVSLASSALSDPTQPTAQAISLGADSLNINLPNPSDMGTKTYSVNVFKNDSGAIDKASVKLSMDSMTGKNFTVGGTKFSINDNGDFTVTISSKTTLSDFTKPLQYTVSNSSGTQMGLSTITLNATQLGDPVKVPDSQVIKAMDDLVLLQYPAKGSTKFPMQTVTKNIVANDMGPVDKSSARFVTPGGGATKGTIGGTTYSLNNGVLTVTTTRKSTVADIHPLKYMVKSLDGKTTSYATVNIGAMKDDTTRLPMKAMDDTLKIVIPKAGSNRTVSASVNLLANDANVSKGAMVHLIDPRTGKHVTSFSNGVVKYSVMNGVLTVSAPANVHPGNFINVRYAVMGMNGSDSEATVTVKAVSASSTGSGVMTPMVTTPKKTVTHSSSMVTGPKVVTDYVK